jgi:uncharacterized RDD family membrane protein YckC
MSTRALVPGEQLPPADATGAAWSVAPQTLPAPEPAVAATPAGPWPRFVARKIDLSINLILLGGVIGMVRPSVIPSDALNHLGATLLLGLLSLPFAMILDAVVYSVFGNTPGKWLAGIRVMRFDKSSVPFATYLRRNFGVYWSGLGANVPLVTLITLLSAHDKASRGEAQSWDEAAGTRAYKVAPRGEHAILASVIYLLDLAWVVAMQISRLH